jgi:hypothetical protein
VFSRVALTKQNIAGLKNDLAGKPGEPAPFLIVQVLEKTGFFQSFNDSGSFQPSLEEF